MYMYIRTYIHTYVRTYVHMYVCMYVHTYVCTYICMYVRTYVCVYIYMHLCMYIYIHTYIHTYILTVGMAICSTHIYTGAEILDSATPSYTSLLQPARVVMFLMRKYLHKGYHLFTDRYYTSIPLAKALHHAQTALTGTVQHDRIDLPDDIRAGVHLRGGDIRAFRAEELMCLAWTNTTKKVPVFMVSTACSAGMTTVASRHG